MFTKEKKLVSFVVEICFLFLNCLYNACNRLKVLSINFLLSPKIKWLTDTENIIYFNHIVHDIFTVILTKAWMLCLGKQTNGKGETSEQFKTDSVQSLSNTFQKLFTKNLLTAR